MPFVIFSAKISVSKCLVYWTTRKLTSISSRSDAFFGNNHIFNQTIFDETRAFWTEPVLDADMLANGKMARQLDSKAYNPTYTFTSTMEQFSLGEVAAPIIAFGDMQSITVNRTLVEYFFSKFYSSIKPPDTGLISYYRE